MALIQIDVPDGFDHLVLVVHNTLTPYALDAIAAENGYSEAEHGTKLEFFQAMLVNYVRNTTVNHFAEQDGEATRQTKIAEYAALFAGKIGTL